uniref:Uncharacterized protein n=1 Tax=Onchocerca volvulus TaxID=6282 RepID=A0A8R1XZB2_ONCVO
MNVAVKSKEKLSRKAVHRNLGIAKINLLVIARILHQIYMLGCFDIE